MQSSPPENLYMALIHYPVYDKNYREVASCITNLDLHDLARCAATFGVKRFYVATPMAPQRDYALKLTAHWTEGMGGRYNPSRKQALESIRIVGELEDVIQEVEKEWGREPMLVATGAKGGEDTISHNSLRKNLFDHSKEIPYIIVFGTGWGLAKAVTQRADYMLEPIRGVYEFNHLSVRCAAAITLDRLTETASVTNENIISSSGSD